MKGARLLLIRRRPRAYLRTGLSYYRINYKRREYRRTPQQRLSGASHVLDRDQLLARAKYQRYEREQQRKKLQCCILIQARVKSFLIRCKIKRDYRIEFDNLLKGTNKIAIVDANLLDAAAKRLLFFYWDKEDRKRLSLLSQLILRNHVHILKLAAIADNSWLWHIRRVLALDTNLLGDTSESATVPLRLLEIFTCVRGAGEVVGTERAARLVSAVLSHLIPRGYLSKVRAVLEARTPPLLSASSQPPSPMAGSLFELLTRPLYLANAIPAIEFRSVMKRICTDILCPRLSEPVRLFLIPALSDLDVFPFNELVEAVQDLDSTLLTPSLLFALLKLEKRHFSPTGKNGLRSLIYYLQALSQLSENLRGLAKKSDEQNNDDDDDDFDEENENVAEHEAEEKKITRELLIECVELMNDEARVEELLSAVKEASEPLVLNALCQVCHNLLLSSNLAVHNSRLLYMLAFKPAFLRDLWRAVSTVSQTSVFGYCTPLIQVIARGSPITASEAQQIVPLLAVFCALFTLLLTTLHDTEFYGDQSALPSAIAAGRLKNPFPLSELMTMSRMLKDVSLGLVNLAFPETRPSQRDATPADGLNVPSQHTQVWANLFKVVVKLVRQLHARDSHRPFCPDGHWVSKQVALILGVSQPVDLAVRRRRLRGYRPFRGMRAFTREDMEVDGPPLTTKEVRTATLLQELPFLVPFQERVSIFQTIVFNDKMEHQGEAAAFLHGPSIQICVRRNYLYEDAFDRLSLSNEPELRLKMRVELVNMAGVSEAGVDGGGLSREFLTELLKTAFDPNRGFFKLTNDNMLYPNPSVQLVVPQSFVDHYFFIGRVLGKALYENLLVELPLAEFFLQKLISRQSDVDIHHLESLDPVLYKNLLFLKNYDGDVQDLGLDFTVLTEELGERRSEELKRNGATTTVTNSNRIEYIHLVADFKLNRQIRQQCEGFRAGLISVIPLEWIHMFNSRELQLLIAGAEVPVDVNDLRANTDYSGGYSADHPTIKIFWNVMSHFTDVQKGLLLKFVTSCSRPPLLGFKELDPPFCIQHAGVADRLPTASTCMNLLKLPEFHDEQQLTEKLVYAITAGAGFELS